jgi:hypothetical protein
MITNPEVMLLNVSLSIGHRRRAEEEVGSPESNSALHNGPKLSPNALKALFGKNIIIIAKIHQTNAQCIDLWCGVV